MDEELRDVLNVLTSGFNRLNGALDETVARLTRAAQSASNSSNSYANAANTADKLKQAEEQAAAATRNFAIAMRSAIGTLAMTPNTVARSNDSFGAATAVLDNLRYAASNIGKAFKDLAGSQPEFGKILEKFNNTKWGQFFNYFSKGLTAAASAALQIATMQIQNTQAVVNSFDTLTASGATFGVSLDQANAAANQAGLDLENFAKVVSSNASSLALLGSGINNAAKFTTTLSRSLAVTNPELLTVYGGLTGLNQAVIDYASTQQRLGVDTVRNQDDIRAGTQFYLRELKELQTVTGKNKEQIRAELEQRIKYAANQTALNELTQDQRTGLTRDFGKLSPMLQQAAIDILTAQNAGMEAVSETVINLRAASPQMVSLIEQIVANNKNLDPAAAKEANAGLVKELKRTQDAERQRNKQLFALGAQRPEVLAGTAFETLERTIFEMGPLQAQMGTAVKSAAEASIAISEENKKFVDTYRDINLSLLTFRQQMQNLAATSLPQTVSMINAAYQAGQVQYKMLEVGVSVFNKLAGFIDVGKINMPAFPELNRPNLTPPAAASTPDTTTPSGSASGPVQTLPAALPVSMADPNVLRLSSAQLTAQEEANRLLRQIADQTA